MAVITMYDAHGVGLAMSAGTGDAGNLEFTFYGQTYLGNDTWRYEYSISGNPFIEWADIITYEPVSWRVTLLEINQYNFDEELAISIENIDFIWNPRYTSSFETKDYLRGNDEIYGNNYNDMIRGFGGDDELHSYNGRDKIFGGNGNDSIYAGAGKDKLIGGRGSDLLQGDQGNDLLKGGGGRDFFAFNTDGGIFDLGRDRIKRFQEDRDRIMIEEIYRNDIEVSRANGNTYIEHDDGLFTIVLVNETLRFRDIDFEFFS